MSLRANRAMPKSVTLMVPSWQQHDVLGLDVPVDNAVVMGMLQGPQDLDGEVNGFLPVEHTLAVRYIP